MPKHEKAKAKTAGQKSRSGGSYIFEENPAPTLEEITDRTLNRLHNLGNQRFALSPFAAYFDRWLMSLRDVISEFESNPSVSVDDQFAKERSQILAGAELGLREKQHREASREGFTRSFSDNRLALKRIEEDYAAKEKQVEGQKRSEIKRLSSNVDALKEELERIVRMKTGFFRAVSNKAKAQREAEATRRLNSAQVELASAVKQFTAQEERLRDEYERRKQPVVEMMRDQQREIEKQEIDDSLEARRVACEALVKAVNGLLQRKNISLH